VGVGEKITKENSTTYTNVGGGVEASKKERTYNGST